MLATVDGDYPEWRRDRHRYYAWVIPIAEDTVQVRRRQVQRMLADHLVADRRVAHVTLFVCGFATARPRFDDDVSHAIIDRQARRLRRRCSAPLPLAVGAANSFRSAVFLEVRCPTGALAGIRRELGALVREPRFSDYVPHVTVGVFRAPFPVGVVAAALAGYRALPWIEFDARRIDLVSYDATEPGGSLNLEKSVDF